MEWIKVYSKHYEGWPKYDIANMVCLQMKVARLERKLTQKEMLSVVSQAGLDRLSKLLVASMLTIDEVVLAVLYDVQQVKNSRTLSKQRSENYRNRAKNYDSHALPERVRHDVDKIREEKRRLSTLRDSEMMMSEVSMPEPDTRQLNEKDLRQDIINTWVEIVNTTTRSDIDHLKIYPQDRPSIYEELGRLSDVDIKFIADNISTLAKWVAYRSDDSFSETLKTNRRVSLLWYLGCSKTKGMSAPRNIIGGSYGKEAVDRAVRTIYTARERLLRSLAIDEQRRIESEQEYKESLAEEIIER